MRKVLISIAAAGAALVAAPSMAQSWGNGGGYGQPNYGNGGYNSGYGNSGYGRPGSVSPWQVRDMVERAINRGEISRHDARELREDVRDLLRRAERVRYDGRDWGARRDLDRRANDILRNLQRARADGGRYGYGRGDRDGRYDRPGY